jgi:integrase
VNLIAEWVGHSKISTTMDIYMEAEKEKQLEVVIERI